MLVLTFFSYFREGVQNYRAFNSKCGDKLVKVLTKEEWVQLNDRIHASEIGTAKLKRDIEARESIKNKSFEIHKDWTNTILVRIWNNYHYFP